MTNTEDHETIDYYNRFAELYFNNTVNVDMSENCDRFIKYIRPGGRIIDIGAGSGRDILYFKQRGFQVEGIDASAELCKLASRYAGVEVKCQKMQDWHSADMYDGIWANASLLHLEMEEIEKFILKAISYLSEHGVMYISLKSGIATGTDAEGRFFMNLNEKEVHKIISKNILIQVVEFWKSQDNMRRNDLEWINMILQKNVKELRRGKDE